MGSREVKLANEPSDRQLRALYIQFEHSLMLVVVFPSDKEFRSILDASISIIHLRHVWKAVVWESPEIQFCKWPFPPSGAQTIKWGEIAKWFLCTDTLSRWNCTTPRGRYSNSVTVQHSSPNDDMMRQLRKKCYSVAKQTMTSMVWTTKKILMAISMLLLVVTMTTMMVTSIWRLEPCHRCCCCC